MSKYIYDNSTNFMFENAKFLLLFLLLLLLLLLLLFLFLLLVVLYFDLF